MKSFDAGSIPAAPTSEENDEYAPILSFFGWELWPWTDHWRWMLTHNRLMICE